MIGYLEFGEINTQDYNAMFSDSFLFSVADNDYDTYSIDGRNGDLHIDNGRKKNFTHNIKGVIPFAYKENYFYLRTLLLQSEGYLDIRSNLNTDIFRKGKIDSISNISSNPQSDIVTFYVKVTFRPELYLRDGEDVIEFTKDGTITNPTPCESRPLLKILGKGKINVGETVIDVNTAVSSGLIVDIDNHNAYEETDNGKVWRNSYITVNEWGYIPNGENVVSLGKGIEKVEITPRWCYL